MAEKIDLVLDKCLVRLKAGETVENCLRDYPECRVELESLLSAAACLYAMPEVNVSEDFRRSSRVRLMSQIRGSETCKRTTLFRIPFFERLNWRPLVSAAMVAILVLMTVLLVTWNNLPLKINPSEFTLSVLGGNAQMRSADSNVWQEAEATNSLLKGSAVRTAPGSYAVITFFDGSTATLNPETVVEVTDSSFLNGQSAHIVLNQLSGKTWNNVIGSGGEKPYYEVQTPSVSLVAQGTAFSSEIDALGATNVAVIEGTVKVTDKQDDQISVAQDQQLHVENKLAAASPIIIPAVQNQLVFSVGLGGIGSVSDPNGASTGLLPNGVSFNQIPNSKTALTVDAQIIQIQEPASGEYIITVRRIDQGAGELGIQLTSGNNTVYQKKIVLPTTTADGWTVHFKVGAASAVSAGEIVSIESMPVTVPASVVQMPLAIQRATAVTAAAITNTTVTTKTAVTTAQPAAAATQNTGTTKPVITPATTVKPPAPTAVVPPAAVPPVTSTTAATTPVITVPPNISPIPTKTTPATPPAVIPPNAVTTTTKTTSSAASAVK